MSGKKYDVFLSHHSADKPAVQHIANKLRREGIIPFLDVWSLIPGDPWQDALENALAESEVCAVFLGPNGYGPWARIEMRTAVDLRGKRPYAPSVRCAPSRNVD